MKTKRIELPFEVKEISSDGSFKGYASAYGNVDLGMDRIESFAAKQSLKNSGGKMPILRDHSAKIQDIVGENLGAVEDDKGLFVDGKFDLDRESGLDTYKAVKFAKEAGRKMGLSIGYIVDQKQVDFIDGVRVLKKIDVVEYSVVVFPMNPKAKITSIKSFCEDATEEEISHKKREIEAALRDVDCSQKEQKAAVSAIFAMRDAGKKEAEEIEAKKQSEFSDDIKSVLENIKRK